MHTVTFDDGTSKLMVPSEIITTIETYQRDFPVPTIVTINFFVEKNRHVEFEIMRSRRKFKTQKYTVTCIDRKSIPCKYMVEFEDLSQCLLTCKEIDDILPEHEQMFKLCSRWDDSKQTMIDDKEYTEDDKCYDWIQKFPRDWYKLIRYVVQFVHDDVKKITIYADLEENCFNARFLKQILLETLKKDRMICTFEQIDFIPTKSQLEICCIGSEIQQFKAEHNQKYLEKSLKKAGFV